jgi:hypothetical protein
LPDHFHNALVTACDLANDGKSAAAALSSAASRYELTTAQRERLEKDFNRVVLDSCPGHRLGAREDGAHAMAWWSSLPQADRMRWLERVMSGVIEDAWREYKTSTVACDRSTP